MNPDLPIILPIAFLVIGCMFAAYGLSRRATHIAYEPEISPEDRAAELRAQADSILKEREAVNG